VNAKVDKAMQTEGKLNKDSKTSLRKETMLSLIFISKHELLEVFNSFNDLKEAREIRSVII